MNTIARTTKLYLAGKRQQLITLAAIALVFTLAVPAFAQEAAPTLEFDLTPFFDSLNQYLPIFIGLFAIVGGIAGAMALSKFIIGQIVAAFSGRGV